MDVAALGLGITGGGAVCGLILYAIRSEMRGDVTRLDGRINTHEAGCTERQRALTAVLHSIDSKINRFEEKLDRLVEDR